MKKILFTAAALALLFWLLLPPPLQRDAPRDLPWTLPDYRSANVHWDVDELGRIHNRVEHFFLDGISPQMVSWFYSQLPIATVEYRGETYPLYHIFHPTEHGRIRLLVPASDGRQGMGPGAVVMREEWFGPYDSTGRARLVTFGDSGMRALPEVAGLRVGQVDHSWQAEAGGTRYRVDAMLGVDWPLLGPLVNWGIRRLVFHPAMMAEWQRHQVQEVSSLQFFLADLYAQRGQGNHYILAAPAN